MSQLFLPKDPTVKQLQQYVAEMMRERGFADQEVAKACLLLTEEVGELCKCVRKMHTDMRIDANKKYEFDIAGEIADVLIVLTCIANRLGIDLEQAFRDKEAINKQRTWQ